MEAIKRFCHLSDLNRYKIILAVIDLLKKDGANVYASKYNKLVEWHLMPDYKNEETVTLISSEWAGGYSLHFVLNGYAYDINYDDNPFFPIVYCKFEIEKDGTYTGRNLYESNEDHKNADGLPFFSICYDCLFKEMDAEQVAEAAAYHYECMKKYIINGMTSRKDYSFKYEYNYMSGRRQRVRQYDRSKYNYLKDLCIKL